MYQPRHFAAPDDASVDALLREHPLAALVSQTEDGLTADHLPLEWDPAGRTLRGHIARANPLARRGGAVVMAIFRGPQAYVSPSWYPSKAEHHQVVPTWNYAVVHAHGRLALVDDADWLRALVGRLTDHHERPRAAPWSVDDAPADYIGKMLAAIVGIEIRVERLDAKWKLSQNRSAADRAGVAQGLAAEPGGDAAAMAAWIAPPGAAR